MAPPPPKKQTVRHFTDPKHPLHLVTISDEFLCNGCRELGHGTRFRCEACDVNLHEFCATCPATIRSSVLQTEYPLTLVNEHPLTERICDLCRDPIEGLHYSCPPCAVELHPLCTQLPLHARLSQHPEHLMKLQTGELATCTMCLISCTSWRYRCDACCIDIHLECVSGDRAHEAPAVAPLMSRKHSSSVTPPPPLGIPISGDGGDGGDGDGGDGGDCDGDGGDDDGDEMEIPEDEVDALTSSGKKKGRKRKIFGILARVTFAAATTAVIGVPLTL
ncbi:hypothetical protein ABFS82_06G127900 [Erythranthe guttata]|uniref:diacylglycerol kinase theta-like n=1 Tax=Erythranthe guttata TaxID=4155 RepID=UPI00064E0030|nr:PREDICTED: diacylglycerol kinase theta-like [Erythranthe guttata]|eukprot:XP_012839951.1 PREDICTED: diacylglycerol kinase theta-like [Erythranthe guttata]